MGVVIRAVNRRVIRGSELGTIVSRHDEGASIVSGARVGGPTHVHSFVEGIRIQIWIQLNDAIWTTLIGQVCIPWRGAARA